MAAVERHEVWLRLAAAYASNPMVSANAEVTGRLADELFREFFARFAVDVHDPWGAGYTPPDDDGGEELAA